MHREGRTFTLTLSDAVERVYREKLLSTLKDRIPKWIIYTHFYDFVKLTRLG